MYEKDHPEALRDAAVGERAIEDGKEGQYDGATHPVRVASYNVNALRKIEYEPVRPNEDSDPERMRRYKMANTLYDAYHHIYSFRARKFRIFSDIHYLRNEREAVDLLAFQEVPADHAKSVQDYLDYLGLNSECISYNATEGAFCHIIAYDKERFEKTSDVEIIYLTPSGQASTVLGRTHNCGTIAGRCVPVCTFLDKETDAVFKFASVHFGVEQQHRDEATEKLCNALPDDGVPMIMAGDYNRFMQTEFGVYEPQCERLREAGFTEADRPQITFWPNPYDVDRHLLSEERNDLNRLLEAGDVSAVRAFFLAVSERLGASAGSPPLDAIFTRNATQIGPTQVMGFCDGVPVHSTTQEQLSIHASRQQQLDEPSFDSDHMLILAKFTLPTATPNARSSAQTQRG